jgi:hypothetical protein
MNPFFAKFNAFNKSTHYLTCHVRTNNTARHYHVVRIVTLLEQLELVPVEQGWRLVNKGRIIAAHVVVQRDVVDWKVPYVQVRHHARKVTNRHVLN